MKRSTLRTLLILLVVGAIIAGFFIFGNKKPQEDDSRASIFDYYTGSSTTYSSTWNLGSNTGKLNTSVDSSAREKYTKIRGNNRDTITILVYMCGTDLESRSAMASYDLQEMANATLSDNINLIVYTGGCKSWHIDWISNSVNQIYKISNGGQVERLVDNAGNGAMVDPNTLLSFIEWGVENYQADRYDLIFWDHGSGTIGGYGYDEKYSSAGNMDIAEIDQVLTAADVKWDFVGFDTCLMGTTETALMLTEHADYMVASEESEPGIGWYYTDWLTKLSANTSMPTIEIGKNIIDSFVSETERRVPQQSGTLSLIDLAEFEATVPSKLKAFSTSSKEMIANQQYKTISKARSGSREFASAQQIDMVDLVDMSSRVNTTEGNELAQALLNTIKYNKTTKDMANSYGLSIYFPYRSLNYINRVLKVYDSIEMDESYSDCIRSFASYQGGGQISSGGSTNPYASLGNGSYSNNTYSSQSSVDDVTQLLNLFLGGTVPSQTQQTPPQQQTASYDPYALLLQLGMNMLFGRSNIDTRSVAEYITENHFDADLNWKNNKIALTEKQWDLVDKLQLHAYVDDGSGYIDLGSDNIYEIDDNGNLIGNPTTTWLAISFDNEHYEVAPYYYINTIGTEEDYIINGYIPVLLNGERANLLVSFTDENPSGDIIGVSYNLEEQEGQIGKNSDGLGSGEALNLTVNLKDEGEKTTSETVRSGLMNGDVIELVCDYYNYNGTYDNSYVLGKPLTVTDHVYIGDVDITNYKVVSTYQITDIYQQNYFTAPF